MAAVDPLVGSVPEAVLSVLELGLVSVDPVVAVSPGAVLIVV